MKVDTKKAERFLSAKKGRTAHELADHLGVSVETARKVIKAVNADVIGSGSKGAGNGRGRAPFLFRKAA